MKTSVRVLIGLIFLASGCGKVIPDHHIHHLMLKEFKKYTPVFPMKHFNMQIPDPLSYMQAVGFVEVVWGIMLLVGTCAMRRKAAMFLSIVMLGAIYTHFVLNEYTGCIVPIGIIAGLIWTMEPITSVVNADGHKHDHDE